MKKFRLIPILLCVSMLLISCGSSSSSTDSKSTMAEIGYTGAENAMTDASYGDAYYEGNDVVSTADSDHTSSDMPDISEDKMIYRCDITMETKTFDESCDSIRALISSYKGFIQEESKSDNDYGWYYEDYIKDTATQSAWISCRIPSASYDQFLADLEAPNENSKITNKSSNAENISQAYQNNDIRIKALEIQEERLLQMLEEAQTIQDMLDVESRLSTVQTELNLLKTNRAGMDMDVAYSYVTIRLEEVMEYTVTEEKDNFFTRMWNTFLDVCAFTGDLFESVLTFIMYLIPVVIVAGIPLFLIFKLIWFIVKKLQRKTTKAASPSPAAPPAGSGKFTGNQNK